MITIENVHSGVEISNSNVLVTSFNVHFIAYSSFTCDHFASVVFLLSTSQITSSFHFTTTKSTSNANTTLKKHSDYYHSVTVGSPAHYLCTSGPF